MDTKHLELVSDYKLILELEDSTKLVKSLRVSMLLLHRQGRKTKAVGAGYSHTSALLVGTHDLSPLTI